MPKVFYNTPVTFQHIIDNIISNQKFIMCKVILKWFIFLKTFTNHLKRLKSLFHQLAINNLKLKSQKFNFFSSKLEYLRFVIKKQGLHP